MSVYPDDLWIGDRVRTTDGKIVGRYEGESSPGMARVRAGDEYFAVPFSDLQLADEPEPQEVDEEADQASPGVLERTAFSNTIDLHIEVLNPEMADAEAAVILRYQLRKCSEFLDRALEHRVAEVRIIHGKGTGVLRKEVEILLADHPAVWQYFPARGEGTVDVVMKY